jgi:hypothetical protein
MLGDILNELANLPPEEIAVKILSAIVIHNTDKYTGGCLGQGFKLSIDQGRGLIFFP